MTYYIIQKPIHRSGINTLCEFDAENDTEARTTFSLYIATMLEEDPNSKCRLVIYERWLGGWVDQSLAHATPEDLEAAPPAWYSGPGYYDESDNLILGVEDRIDRIELGDYVYFVTPIEQEGPKEWQR